MKGAAKEKTPTQWAIKQARQEGYDQGFADGMCLAPDFSKAYQKGFQDGRHVKSKRPRPKLLKALVSSEYRARYFSGYRRGYESGLYKARQVELKAISIRDQPPRQEREEPSR